MEENIRVFDWERLLIGFPPELYLIEIAFKSIVIFLILMLVLRMLGKRAQQQISPMQQLLMIALGSAAGDALLYPTVPLAYAALILLGVSGLTMLLELASARFRPVRDYVESRPRVLVRDGNVDWDALGKERTTRRELFAELRVNGARSLSQVEAAILEVTGEISVFLNDRKPADKNLLEYVFDEDPDEAPQPDPKRER